MYIVCGRVPWLYQYWPGGFMVLCPGTPEGSTCNCSGFKASQKTGQQLKVSSDRLGEARLQMYFCGHVHWLYQYWPGGFMPFVVLCPGTPEGSTGSGSGFKVSQKTGQQLKVSSDRLGEAGNRTCDPWFTRHRSKCVFVAMFLGCTSTGRVGLCFLWVYVQELPKAQLAVVLVLKCLRRRGNSLKSHPTDWEKPGIEPATPGLQDIGLSPTPRRLLMRCMVANKSHAYIEKGVYSKYTVHKSIIFGIQLHKFKFGSIYVFILKLMNFILLIYFYLVVCFCVKILKKFQLFLRQNIISNIFSCLP